MTRKFWWAAILACCILSVLSVSVNTARRGTLVDNAGQPIANAFVVYYYSAGVKLIWPWAHYDGPYLSRTDQAGRFAVPFRAHLRFPLVTLTSPVSAYMGVYAPELHNSCDISFERADTDSYCFKSAESEGGRVFTMRDLHDNAIARFRTLWLLIYGPRALAQGPLDQRRELVAAARREYDQFLAEYGNVVFGNPTGAYVMASPKDWTQESTEHRPWRFFLQDVPFYGITMEKRLAELERQTK